MGGGGDVVGALGVSRLLRAQGSSETVLGGIAWERSPIDPRPGPRSLEEIQGGRPCGRAAVLADPETTSIDGVAFAESRMAEHLDEPVLLLDITRGPKELAAGLCEAGQELGCDLVILVDVGGDVLAHGDEPGLASPLCDAIVLAAGAELSHDGTEVLAAVYGPGCDGELTAWEVLDRIAVLREKGALRAVWSLDDEACELVLSAAELVQTEASVQAVRCARGERGEVPIRGGRRTVELTPLGGLVFVFDPAEAAASAPLAAAVAETADLEAGNRALLERGVNTELELERERAKRAERDGGAG